MNINNADTESFESTLISEEINGHDTIMLVNSGSVANIIDYDFFKEIRTKEQNRILLSGTTRSQQQSTGGC